MKDTMTKNTAKTKETKIKTLTPAAARREIGALERLLDDQDIDLQVFWRLKQSILDNLEAI